jgi:NADH-quinone oxidoreductase subunit L
MTLEIQFAWLCLVFPLVGVLLTPVFTRISPTARDVGPVFFAFLTAASTVMLLPLLFTADRLPIESSNIWLNTPIVVDFGILLDALSIIVANVVAVISFFIMVYCLGYMKGDPSVMRFWMLMNAFIGSMLLLVLANNLLFIFIGWKLVGLCSYGLIGYYYRDEEKYWIGGPAPTKFEKPSSCGLKALVVTGVGDMLMLAGILIIYYYAGTLNLLELYRTVPEWIPELAATPGMMVLVSLLLVAGPVGKSAQFPFHEWLPEAMAGPGPVSALIHAATMVKSGVFLIARLIPIFYYGYWVAGIESAMTFFVVVAWVGAITAFLAASQGLVALELKKALAYSTVSQIGYMMLALGVAGFSRGLLVEGYTAGIFHLMSHAVFKACLFLCAGTVIHTAHSIYIHEMGALRKYMPFTWLFMILAAFSLMGVPPLPGFWSKDLVLLTTLETQHYLLFLVAGMSAIFTAFYTVRFIGMIFHGDASRHIRKQEAKKAHLGEGYRSQTFACGALAVGIVVMGLLGLSIEHKLNDLFTVSLTGHLSLPVVDHQRLFPGFFVPSLAVLLVLIGAFPAYQFYISGKWQVDSWFKGSGLIRGLHRFLWERWYIDKLLNLIFVRGSVRLSDFVARVLENAWDALVHKALPITVTRGGNSLLQVIRADAKDLGNNIAYVLAMAIFFLLAALLWKLC